MDILYLLIPLSLLIMLGVIGIFAWALHSGQFDAMEAQAQQALHEDAATDEEPSP